jgi:hypothetical protein
MRTARQFGESGATRPAFVNLWQVSAVYVRKSVSRARERDGDGALNVKDDYLQEWTENKPLGACAASLTS